MFYKFIYFILFDINMCFCCFFSLGFPKTKGGEDRAKAYAYVVIYAVGLPRLINIISNLLACRVFRDLIRVRFCCCLVIGWVVD